MKQMILNRILLYATILAISSLGNSCSDEFFREVPGDRVVPEDHYTTAIEVEISYLGAFALLQDVVPNIPVVNGVRADLMDVTANADLPLRDMNRHLYGNYNNPYIDASGFYRIIINANEVLENMDLDKINDPDFTEIEYNLYRGDLIGLRSWVYFNLARLYGQVAYIPDNMTTLPDEGELVYLDRETMFDTLLLHLDEEVLNSDYFSSDFRINKHALVGEIYLEMNQYQLAADFLLQACSVNEYNHYKCDIQYANRNWSNIFINSQNRTSTVMSVVPYSQEDQQLNYIEQLTSFAYDYKIRPTQGIISLFEAQVTKRGARGDLYRGAGVSYVTDTLTGVSMINKYSLDESGDFNSAVILYRAADVHLLLAEAMNRLGEGFAARNIMNSGHRLFPFWSNTMGIRGRVYLFDRPLGNMTAMEDAIMEERALELAFEGKRWFDLMRIARRRNNNAYLADRVASKFSDPDIAASVRERLMDENNWYLPVK